MARNISPALFQPEMILAIDEGRKTMTRRLASVFCKKCQRGEHRCAAWKNMGQRPSPWQKYKVGDLLWTRETYRFERLYDDAKPSEVRAGAFVYYEATPGGAYPGEGSTRPRYSIGKVRPGIHMPRAFSRFTLEIVSTKIEQVQEISEEDALAEGIKSMHRINHRMDGYGLPGWPEDERSPTPAAAFRRLWISINGNESWEANPEVVAVAFKIHRCNVDKFEG